MKDHRIVGIHITDRAINAAEVQQILSKYGKTSVPGWGCMR